MNPSDVLQLYSACVQVPVRYYDEITGEIYSCSLSSALPCSELADHEIIRYVLSKTDCRTPYFYISPDAEMYGALPQFTENTLTGLYITGPGRLRHISEQEIHILLQKSGCWGRTLETRLSFLRTLPLVSRSRMRVLLGMLHYMTTGVLLPEDYACVENNQFRRSVQITSKESVGKELFVPEVGINTSYTLEKRLIDIVKNGKTELLPSLGEKCKDSSFGILGPNYIRHLKNLYIVTTTIVSRAAIEAGVSESYSFTLSDKYIQKLESTENIMDIHTIAGEMISIYTHEVRRLKDRTVPISKPVNDTMGYINCFYMENLTVQSIAHELGYSPNYLGHLFRSETGKSINQYLLKQRLNAAERLLSTTNLTVTDISSQLSMPSSSYLCEAFRKAYGISPTQYRRNFAKTKTPSHNGRAHDEGEK